MAAHKLPRLSKSLLDVPQLITVSRFREIAEVLENRDFSIEASAFGRDDDNKKSFLGDGGKGFGDKDKEYIGVLEVDGPLTYKSTGWEALCGGTSYQELMKQIDTFAEEGIKKVVMLLDSPGGQAFRAFSTAKYIRDKCDEYDIKLIGYVDGQSCSAGYALGCVCHELISNGDSSIGSIGVVVSLINTSEKDKKAGIERTYITSGNSKVPFDSEGKFKKEFVDDLQAKITKTYGKFVQHVSSMRALESQKIRDTQAKVYDADDALSIGLIDSIMEEHIFRKYVSDNGAAEFISAQHLRQRKEDAERCDQIDVVETQLNKETKEGTTLMPDENITPERLAQLEEQLASLQAENAVFKAKEVASVKENLSAGLNDITFLTGCKEQVVDFLMSADETSKSLMTTVIESAKAEHVKVMEEAASQIATKETELSEMKTAVVSAEEKAQAAKEETLAVKEEFGVQTAITGEVIDKNLTAPVTGGNARTKQLEALVKNKLANK